MSPVAPAPSKSPIDHQNRPAEPSALRPPPQHYEHIESAGVASDVEHSADTATCTITTLTFDINIVPNPPPTSFANNVDLLFSEWYQSQRVIVAGQGIPIRHWDKLYCTTRPEFVWRSMQSNWNNWKVSSNFGPPRRTRRNKITLPFTQFIVEEYETFPIISRVLEQILGCTTGQTRLYGHSR